LSVIKMHVTQVTNSKWEVKMKYIKLIEEIKIKIRLNDVRSTIIIIIIQHQLLNQQWPDCNSIVAVARVIAISVIKVDRYSSVFFNHFLPFRFSTTTSFHKVTKLTE
jgi:NADH:ubiquinone oxidoreductase subunit E